MADIISQFEKDQLIEVINIGASKAATALASMIGGKKVLIQPPEAFIDSAEKAPAFVGKLQEVETVVLLKFLGDVPGIMMLSFSPQAALKLASFLTQGHKKQLPVLDEMDRSALCEAGNVLSGSAIASLSKFLDLNILQSVPDTATDMLGSIIDAVVVEMAENSGIILAFRVKLTIIDDGKEDIPGQLFFMFEPKSTDKILAALKKKFSIA